MPRTPCPTPARCGVAEHDVGTRAAAKCTARSGQAGSSTAPPPSPTPAATIAVVEETYVPPKPRVLGPRDVKYFPMNDLLDEVDGEVDDLDAYLGSAYPGHIAVLVGEGYLLVEADEDVGVEVDPGVFRRFDLGDEEAEEVEYVIGPYTERIQELRARHSLDGPVISRAGGAKEWWVEGYRVSPSKWLKKARGITVAAGDHEAVDQAASSGYADLERLGEAIEAGSPVEWAIAYASAEAS